MVLHARFIFFLCISLGLGVTLPTSRVEAAEHALKIQIIHATKSGKAVDPELRSLVRDFSQLKFSSFRIIDRAQIKVAVGATSKFQLPNGLWMDVALKELDRAGGLRLNVSAQKLKFKSTIAIKPGGTVAVGGPLYKGGALIFTLSREKSPSR